MASTVSALIGAVEPLLPPAVTQAIQEMVGELCARGERPEAFAIVSRSDRRIVLRVDLGPRRVIVKCPPPVEADAGNAALARLNREADAIGYLRGLRDPRLSGVAPALHAHDPALGIVVMEDLTTGRDACSLHDLCVSADRARVVDAVIALARTLGRLHRETFSLRRMSASTASSDAQASREDARRFAEQLSLFDMKMDARSAIERDAVWSLLRGNPSPASFCVGDVSPGNVFISRSGVHVCDFEYAGFQHPALEGTHAGCLFPANIECGALPASLIAQAQAAYGAEFDVPAAVGVAPETLIAAALIEFLFYHWTHTFPEVGVPIAWAGSRSKVLDLTRLLAKPQRVAAFPAIGGLLIELGRRLADQPALAPDRSLPYDGFDETEPDATEISAADVEGLFRINSACHLVVTRLDTRTIAIRVREHPRIQCRAVWSPPGGFTGIEMPLTLTRAADGHVIITDRRTAKTVIAYRCASSPHA